MRTGEVKIICSKLAKFFLCIRLKNKFIYFSFFAVKNHQLLTKFIDFHFFLSCIEIIKEENSGFKSKMVFSPFL